MYKPIKLIILLSFIPFIALSQTVIKGVVYDKESRKPLSGAVVSIANAQGEPVVYDISSDKGAFTLTVTSAEKNLQFVARLLGYKEELLNVDNRSRQLDVFLQQTGIELKEVIIKSRPISISEDTLRYSVNTFKSAGDRVIGDLLKKLPGIEVSKEGGIKYKGEAINKFYIEGLDLLDKKYGIATNNVPVDAVQNVEVIENHQPIKSIKGMVSSAQAAINLKLKDSKMARPVGGVRAGGGYADEINRLLEVFALQAAKKRQTILMYKTNNSGSDITEEFTEQMISLKELQNADIGLQKNILTPAALGTPPIAKERYLFNKTHTASLNNLWKTGEDSQLRVNLNYLNDVRTGSAYAQSEYFLQNTTLQVMEDNSLREKLHQLDGALTYTDNSKSHYVDNALKWKINSRKNTSWMNTNGENRQQSFDMPAALVQNQLNYLKRWGEKMLNIGSFMGFINQPEQLTVLKNGQTDRQEIELSNFYTKTGSYYSWYWGLSGLRLNGDIEASINNIGTTLTHPSFTENMQSNFQSSRLNLALSPLYTYKTDKNTLEIEFPLSQQIIFNTNGLTDSPTETKNYFLFNSRVSVSRKFHPFFSARVSYRYSQTIGDYMDYADAYLMKNYRSFYKPSGVLGLRKSHSVSLSMNYRNPLSTLFINSFLLYAPSETNKTIATRFVGIQSVASDVLMNNKSDMFMAQLYIGKYFSSIKTNVSLNTDYNYYKSSRFQQGALFPFSVNTVGLTAKSNTKVSDLFTFVYQVNYMNNKSLIKTAALNNTSVLNQFAQQIRAYLSPTKRLELSAQFEQSYNELSERSHINMFFANIGAAYKLKNVDFELNWNNIFNKKEYAYSIFSGLDTYSYKYAIRPMSVMLIASFKF